MTTNLGSIDRIVRLLIGVALIVAPLLNMPNIWANSTLAVASMGIGGVLILTSLFRFCPIYRDFGLSTDKL